MQQRENNFNDTATGESDAGGTRVVIVLCGTDAVSLGAVAGELRNAGREVAVALGAPVAATIGEMVDELFALRR